MKSICCVVAALCVFVTSGFAQFPSGALVYLRADANITDSANYLKTWSDESGKALTFYSPTVASRPLVNKTLINGHRTVSFDGVANYMSGPNIFPVNHDYTVCMVVQITNFGITNNIVSGTTHAIYLAGGQYPRFLHNGNFNAQDISTVAVPATPSVIIARYNQSNQYASFYINGQNGDSNKVDINPDSSIYLGAFQAGNLMAGNLSEVLIYPRYLTDTERVHLADSLMKKYAILPPQPPDTTFSEAPKAYELYPRDEDDSATTPISGVLRAQGFDSLYVRQLKNFGAYRYYSVPLHYVDGVAKFSISPRVHAELAEYTYIIGAKAAGRDSILTRRDSIVCGDVYFIDGQSNSIFGGDSYSNEFCRTYGGNASQSKADTLWSISTAAGNGGGSCVGAFGMRIQRDFVEQMGLPTLVITGSVGGTTIEQHLPNVSNPTDLSTIYGSMLFRADRSGLSTKAKALFWYQGESSSITNYFDNFKRLSTAWRLDYPNIKKFYVIQVRIGCAAPGNSSELRDLLRSMSKYYPDVVTHSTMGLIGHDGCHFTQTPQGYHDLGDQLFALLGRDFYHSTDTVGINSPNILSAAFTDDSHTKIKLLFNTSGSGMTIPADSTVSGVNASIKDYFFIGSDTSLVTSLTAHGDTIFLQLAHSTNARTVAYLPDTYYNDTNIIYEGPWLRNNRGLGAFSFWGVPITYILKVGDNIAESEQPLSIYPNPSSGQTTFSIGLQEHSHIRLSLYDELGRELLRPVDEMRDAGRYELSLDTRFLNSSTVIARLEIDGKIFEQKLMIVH
jgi:hypothetical protein